MKRRLFYALFSALIFANLMSLVSGTATADYKKGLILFKVGDIKGGVYEIHRSAVSGEIDAQRAMARLHITGYGGVKKSIQKAIWWFDLAAFQGDLEAQFWLGYSYGKAFVVKKNLVESYAWLKIAADAKDKPSIAILKTVVKQMKPKQIAAGKLRYNEILELVVRVGVNKDDQN